MQKKTKGRKNETGWRKIEACYWAGSLGALLQTMLSSVSLEAFPIWRHRRQLTCILLTGACGVRKWAGPSRRRLTFSFLKILWTFLNIYELFKNFNSFSNWWTFLNIDELFWNLMNIFLKMDELFFIYELFFSSMNFF